MVNRNYSIPDADMMEDSRTTLANFELDKVLFIAVDPYFTDPFSANWLASIEASEGAETAETREDIQQQETAEVLQAMAAARAKYNQVKYYVQVAFADAPAIQHRFGTNDYDKAATDQQQMVLFLNNLHKQCTDPAFNPQLIANGLTPTAIDEITTIRDSLLLNNTEQELLLLTSAKATAQRIAVYNTTYGFRQRINRASKVVFADDPVKLNEYEMPGGSTDENFNAEGKVTDAANQRGLKNVTVLLVELGISDQTTSLGNYGFVAVPPGNYTLHFTLAGYTTVERPITILQSGKVVENVQLSVA